jgi:hypothetical protein
VKVIEHINQAKDTLFSFEILPPLKGKSIQSIYNGIDPLMEFKPKFINVTYHREEYVYKERGNGLLEKISIRKRPGTVGICAAIMNKYDVDAVPHLICGGFSKEEGTTALSMLVAKGSLTPSAAKFIGENTGLMQTSAQKVADGKLSAMSNNVTQLFSALENVPIGASALGATLESWIPFREASEGANAVKVYNSLRDAFTGPVARIISQEVGVLTDKDVKRAQDILPAVGDNAEVRATKITNIKQAIENIKGGAPLSSEAQEWYRENVLTPAGMTDLTGLDFTL